MKQFKRIMVAIDFSNYSLMTLEHAALLARELEAELICINVINQRDIKIMEYSIRKISSYHNVLSVEGWLENLKEGRKQEMEELARTVDLTGIPNSFSFRIGDPFQELFKAVSDENADMIVMGAKGRSDVGDFLVGSTATKMFRRCPVLLVTVRSQEKKPD